MRRLAEVDEIDMSWSREDGAYRNEWAHKPAGLALDRIRPLFRAWARRAGGFEMDLEGLLVSCYLQGFTDRHGAGNPRPVFALGLGVSAARPASAPGD